MLIYVLVRVNTLKCVWTNDMYVLVICLILHSFILYFRHFCFNFSIYAWYKTCTFPDRHLFISSICSQIFLVHWCLIMIKHKGAQISVIYHKNESVIVVMDSDCHAVVIWQFPMDYQVNFITIRPSFPRSRAINQHRMFPLNVWMIVHSKICNLRTIGDPDTMLFSPQ